MCDLGPLTCSVSQCIVTRPPVAPYRYSPGQMYDVVSAVEHYKEFVPWCERSTVLARRGDDYMEAELEVGFKVFVERQGISRRHASSLSVIARLSTTMIPWQSSLPWHVLFLTTGLEQDMMCSLCAHHDGCGEFGRLLCRVAECSCGLFWCRYTSTIHLEKNKLVLTKVRYRHIPTP